jgi:hypothetical protein
VLGERGQGSNDVARLRGVVEQGGIGEPVWGTAIELIGAHMALAVLQAAAAIGVAAVPDDAVCFPATAVATDAFKWTAFAGTVLAGHGSQPREEG